MYTNRPGGGFGTPTPIPTSPTPTFTAPTPVPTTNDYSTRFRNNTDLTVPSYPDSNASSFSWEGSSEGGSLPVFHGTTRSGAHSIREHGFQMDRKGGGVAEELAKHYSYDDNATSNHYFTTNPDTARQMAILAAQETGPGTQAAVVKAKLPPEYRSTLVRDPVIDNYEEVMSPFDTPPGYIQETRNVQLRRGFEIEESKDAFPEAGQAGQQQVDEFIGGFDNLALEDSLREDDDFVF